MKRERRWVRRALRAGVLAVTVGVLGAAAVYGPGVVRAIVDHPYFALTEIVAKTAAETGGKDAAARATHLRPGALLEWTAVRPGTSVWRLDPTRLTTRLERHPWIRRASVRREFPRRLVVEVVERRPAALLLLDHLYYVDRRGLAFAPVGDRERLDYPFITGVEAAIMAGEVRYPRHAIRRAIRLLDLMRAAGLPFRVSEVHIEREQGITVFPVTPRVALTFGWSDFRAKLARLQTVLAGFAGREGQIQEIDLTFAAQAVVRLRQARGGRAQGRV